MKILLLIFTIGLYLLSVTSTSEKEQNKVLLVFLDGFRWDYVSCVNIKSKLKGFSRLRDSGASVERLKPVFPADCFPNFYSIFSGHYPKKHGFLFNDLYNAHNGDAFNHEGNSSSLEIKKWLKVDLIWNQLAKYNIKSKLFHLPICADLEEEKISCVPYDKKNMNLDELRMNVDEAINGLLKNQYSFSVVYNDILDKAGHSDGPLSPKILDDYMPAIDEIIFDILEKLDQREQHNIHLVIASDHGLAESSENVPMNMDRILMRKKFTNFLNRGTSLSIWSDSKDAKEIQNHLIKMNLPLKFYNSTTLPTNWKVDHFENLFPTIYVMADPGFLFETSYLNKLYPGIKSLDERKGWHGYSPDHHEMHTPLFIYGPKVNQGLRLHYKQPIEIIHVYHLLVNLLLDDPRIFDHYEDHLPSRLLYNKPSHNLANNLSNSYINSQNTLKMVDFIESLAFVTTSDASDQLFQISHHNFFIILLLIFFMGFTVALVLSSLFRKLKKMSACSITKFMKKDPYSSQDIMKVPFIYCENNDD